MHEWYYILDGVQKGPFPINQLYGRGIRPDTFVWREGVRDWLPAGQVPEFAAILSGNMPPQAGQPMAPGMPPGQAPAYGQPVYNQGGYAPPPQGGGQAYGYGQGYQAPTPGQAVPYYNHGYHLRDLPSPEQVENHFRAFSITYWVQIVFSISTIVFWILYLTSWSYDYNSSYYNYDDYGYDETYLVMLWASVVILVITAGISIYYRMLILHNAWKAITDKYFKPRTTPGNAVGLLFVPLFVIYWRFVAYKQLGEDMSNYCTSRYFPTTDVGGSTLQAYAVVGALSYIPYLGTLARLALVIFRFLAISHVRKGLIHILMQRQQHDDA